MTPISSPHPTQAPPWAQGASRTQIQFNEQVIQGLDRVGSRRRWRAGDSVVRVGDAVQQASICVSGRFRVIINTIDGHALLLRFLLPGEIFGLPSVFTGAPFPTDVVCDRDGEIISVSKPALEALLAEQPGLAMSLIESLSTRVAELFTLMEDNLLPSLRAKVHRRLMVLANIHGERDKEGKIRLNLSQQDIAQAVNASRQKVHDELKRLEREGLIKLGYKYIVLL